MCEGDAFLKACRACGMLQECQIVGVNLSLETRGRLERLSHPVSRAKQARVTAQRYAAEHLFGKIIVDDDCLRREIGRDAGKSRAILRGLDFEIGVGQES